MKIERKSGALQRKVGPYSRRLQRGPIQSLDGRSSEGRYIRALEAELTATIPGEIFITERLFIDRAIRLRLQCDAFEVKFNAAMHGNGSWTDRDIRAYNSLNNQYRLILGELRRASSEAKKGRRGRPSSLTRLLADGVPR
jgi:hypothetical protein